MRPVMFGNEYGTAWVSPYINSEDGVLTGDMPVVQEIFEDLAKSIGLVYPCGGKPGAAIVRYKKGCDFYLYHLKHILNSQKSQVGLLVYTTTLRIYGLKRNWVFSWVPGFFGRPSVGWKIVAIFTIR